MSVDHASGDASRGYAKWATQVFRAAPPPAVQDWGWPKFAAHTELRARDLIGTDGALRVRATVTVSVSSTDIARSDADACLLAAAAGAPEPLGQDVIDDFQFMVKAASHHVAEASAHLNTFGQQLHFRGEPYPHQLEAAVAGGAASARWTDRDDAEPRNV